MGLVTEPHGHDNPNCPHILGRNPIFREAQIGFRHSQGEVYFAFEP